MLVQDRMPRLELDCPAVVSPMVVHFQEQHLIDLHLPAVQILVVFKPYTAFLMLKVRPLNVLRLRDMLSLTHLHLGRLPEENILELGHDFDRMQNLTWLTICTYVPGAEQLLNHLPSSLETLTLSVKFFPFFSSRNQRFSRLKLIKFVSENDCGETQWVDNSEIAAEAPTTANDEGLPNGWEKGWGKEEFVIPADDCDWTWIGEYIQKRIHVELKLKI